MKMRFAVLATLAALALAGPALAQTPRGSRGRRPSAARRSRSTTAARPSRAATSTT